MRFLEVNGTIIDSETWSETRVSGSSGGVMINGIGASHGRTRSTVSNVSKLWVQTDDGREIAIRANADRFAARSGHRVSMLVAPNKSGPAAMVAGLNHATGEKCRESGIQFVVIAVATLVLGFWFPLLFFMVHVVVGLIASGLFLWGLGYLAVTGVQINSAGGAFMRKISEAKTQQPSVDPAALEAA